MEGQAGQRHMEREGKSTGHKHTMSGGGSQRAKGVMGKGSPCGHAAKGAMGKHQKTGSGY